MPKRPPKILIVILNWNGKKDTLECLSSLKQVTYRHFTSLVIDNGSTDDSVPVIRSHFPNIPIFETKANLGFAGGNNMGISWGLKKPFEWILMLNNDTIVAPNFLEEFLKAAEKQPQAKILGAKIYRYHDRNRIDHLGAFWNPKTAEFESQASNQVDDGVSFEEMKKVETVCGACLFMHRIVAQTIGLLEPKFFLFWEETDFCSRARRKGFEVWIAPKAKIWHKVSSSFVGGKPHMHYFWWRSRLLWIERNCLFQERKIIYKKIIFPELWKTFRHYLLRSFQSWLGRPNQEQVQKLYRYKAGLLGALHYSFGRFGNCPKWLLQSRRH